MKDNDLIFTSFMLGAFYGIVIFAVMELILILIDFLFKLSGWGKGISEE